MKKFLSFLFCFLFLYLYPIPYTLYPVSAHLIGQPPFFKINGTYSGYYPVPSTSLSDFTLPQDIAPENYLINQPINFEIDTNSLPVPIDIVQKTKFIWDFGDGGKTEGLKNTYTYKKPGSFHLIIKADSGEGVGPQLLQSVMLNILPNENYKLPKAAIMVNGWQSKDPLIDILEAKFDLEFKFDGSKSGAGSSYIVEYFWDFGDQSSDKGSKVTHKYTTNPYAVFPVLRVKTSDGFISDAFAEIKEGNVFTNPAGFAKNNLSDNKITKKPNVLRYILVGVGVLVLIYVVAFLIMKAKKKQKQFPRP